MSSAPMSRAIRFDQSGLTTRSSLHTTEVQLASRGPALGITNWSGDNEMRTRIVVDPKASARWPKARSLTKNNNSSMRWPKGSQKSSKDKDGQSVWDLRRTLSKKTTRDRFVKAILHAVKREMVRREDFTAHNGRVCCTDR